MPRTKIVCTIGPASQSREVLRALIRGGMDVARINFSHDNHRTQGQRITLIRHLAKEEGKVVGILADLQGPKLRVGEMAGGEISLERGRRVTLVAAPTSSGEGTIPLPFAQLIKESQPGQAILFADGQIELRVVEAGKDGLLAEVVVGGNLKSNQGASFPGLEIDLPCLTQKDKRDLAFAVSRGVDWVALSFVRRAEDMERLRGLLREHKADVPIIVKIEKREALDDLGQILQVVDGVMVARGDLGLETSPQEVPILQKRIIRECNRAGIPVITATQMLESMMRNPRPTRAEASDVANAIFDGTDALMLSEETAVGEYPVEAVRTMVAIAEAAEENFPYDEWATNAARAPSPTITDAVSQASCKMASELAAKAIITTTASGYTARMVAKHRPKVSIIAVTDREETGRRLALVWGAEPVLVKRMASTDQLIRVSVRVAQEMGRVEKGDRVIITAGVPLGGRGRSNMIKVQIVGED